MLAAFASLPLASSATAHGIGGRGDLPIPKSYFVWAASVAVAASFIAATLLWKTPWAARQATGTPGPKWLATVVRAVSPLTRLAGLVIFLTVLAAAWLGARDAAENLAPVALYVVLWVGVLWASAMLGDIWAGLNPWDTLAIALTWDSGPTPAPAPPDRSLVWSHWPAAAGLFGFVWLELAYVTPSSPRAIAIALTGYTLVMLGCALRFGRKWLQTGEAFTVLFGLVSLIAPVGRCDDGRLTFRLPFTGLATLTPRRGTVAAVLVVLGGTTFDGVSRTPWWGNIIRLRAGWDRTAVNSLGLVATIGVVALGYLVAAYLAAKIGGTDPKRAPSRAIHSLVPIALAYSVAHYFSLLVFEGQSAWRLMSDPLGRGWDLFGTATYQIDYLALTTTTIAVVVTTAMVVGHVAGVVLAHDRSAEDVGGPRAAVAQLPMAAVMVGLTVTGLTLLLSV
jgi:hypothetical protein